MWRAVGGCLAVAVALVLPAGCGDGRPGFCDDLAEAADLRALRRALEAQDLRRATRAAERFAELAAEAPREVRADLEAVAGGVADVVALLRADRADPGTEAAERAAQRRDELDEQLGELARRSSAAESWALRECNLRLGVA